MFFSSFNITISHNGNLFQLHLPTHTSDATNMTTIRNSCTHRITHTQNGLEMTTPHKSEQHSKVFNLVTLFYITSGVMIIALHVETPTLDSLMKNIAIVEMTGLWTRT